MIRRLLPGVLLGVVVLIALALVSDLRQVGENMSRFNWAVYPPALLLTLFNYTLRFFKWDFYLRQLGVKNLSKRESARLFVAGFPLAVTPGKVGEALKAVWLRQATGLPVARGISVVLAERISDGIAVALLSVAGVFAYPRYWPAFAAIAAALVAVVVVSQIRPAAQGLLNLGARLPLVKRFVPGLREFYEGSYALFRPGPTLVAVLLGTVSWLGEGVGFYLILLGLGLPPSLQLAALAVFILSFSTIIGAASALPGGLGAAEVSIAGMLALLANVSPALATTATLLIRLATLWFGVALGLLTWAWSRDLLGLKGENGTTVES